MAEQAALDAVNAALGDLATGNTSSEPAAETKTDVQAAGSDADDTVVPANDSGDGAEGGESDETGGDSGEGAGEEGEAAEAEGAGEGGEPEVNPRRADGTFKSRAEIEAEKAAKKTAKPDDKGEQKPAEPKAKDPVNDPIPDGLKKETRERMQTLVTTAKEQQATIERQQVLFDAIADTGASPDEFGAMLGYMRAVHSDEPKDLEFAYNLLNTELRAIAIKLGKPTAGVDLLAEDAELREAVEAGTLPRNVAEELALSRARKAEATKRQQATTDQASQVRTDLQAAAAAAKQQLNVLGDTLAELDPNYLVYKTEALKTLGDTLKNTSPDKWVETFRKHYRDAKTKILAAQAARPAGGGGAAPQGGTKPQPLRANKQPTGQGAKQPSSALEAMSEALHTRFGV